MDSNELEKEKGITILAKQTSIIYKNHKINLVDTPGHHDFGGEVERIMSMVDGVLILVCATEGPMAQTRFVVSKALQQNIKPIVVINKADRGSARVQEVQNEMFALFCDLNIKDEFADHPVYYCSGREGWAVESVEELNAVMKKQKKATTANCILDGILSYVNPPKLKIDADFSMLISQTESNHYFGKLAIGRINSGKLILNDKLQSVDQKGKTVESNKVLKIMKKLGQEQVEIEKAIAGDIVSIAGFSNSHVTNILNATGKSTVIASIPIDPPIIGLTVDVNNSPIAGKEGSKLTKSQIQERLIQESDNDVALKIRLNEEDQRGVYIQGRGDLHLGLLIEKMRREGYELSVSSPEVLFTTNEQGEVLEPIEKLKIEVEEKLVNMVIEKLGSRGATYESCETVSSEIKRVIFSCPTRGTIGLRSSLLNETKGKVIIESELIGYEPHKGKVTTNNKGAIISTAAGITTQHAIKEIEKFGPLFIKPNQKVYPGMVIGEHTKEHDQEVNPTKKKELTNVRSVEHEENIVLLPPRQFSVEQAISYIRDDELVEITPKEIRIRKKELDSNARRKIKRDEKTKYKK